MVKTIALMTAYAALVLAARGADAAELDPAAFFAAVGVQAGACAGASLSGQTRHVSTTGDDATADGSAAHPYRTLYRAVGDARAGETVVLRQGVYAELNEIRVRVPNLTIRSFPGEWAVVDRSAEADDGSGIYFYVGSDGGALECLEVRGGFYVVSTETKWDWGDPDDRSGASNIRVENAKLHGSQRDVVKIKPGSDDIVIRHCEIYDSGQGQDPGDCNAEGIDNVNGDRTVVAYNHIRDICSTGVYLKGGARDGLIEYNLIERTGAAGVLLGFDTSPEYFDLAVNPGYYENIRGIARHNLIIDTQGAGVGFYASSEARAVYNTLLRTARAYHAPLYFGVTFQDWDPEAGRPANINTSISRNIVISSEALDPPMVSIRRSSELGGLSGLSGGLDIHGNCYWREGGPVTFVDARSDFNGGLAAWRTHVGGEAGSIEEDPLLDAAYRPGNAACSGRGHLGLPGGPALPGVLMLLADR